jgi:hypothetical protein
MAWPQALVDGATAVLRADEPPPGFFASGRSKRGRDVLAALKTLGGEKADAGAAEASRILSTLTLGKGGGLKGIHVQDQRRGPCGPGEEVGQGARRARAA